MFDLIPNGVYKAELEVKTIINNMRERVLRWFEHVRRRPQASPIRRVEALVVDGVRKMGKPKLKWKDILKHEMKEFLLSDDTISDRNDFRAKIRLGLLGSILLTPQVYPKVDVEEKEEVNSCRKTLIKRAIAEDSMYDATRFRKTFRMARPLFNQIVNEVTNHDVFFRNNVDCTGRKGISALIKCTSAIRQLAYDVNVGFLDEYMQISERTSCTALDHFCQAVMGIYGPEYFWKPTVTDIKKLYRHHKEKHGFSRMLGSLDCTDREWFGCPYGFKGQYVRRGQGSNPFILLEVVASQDLWI
nr:hypothetical protein [Tanacetum cinerariifolium]